MSIAENQSLEEYCVETGRRAKRAATAMALAGSDAKNAWLVESASRLRLSQAALLEANQADLDAAPGYGLTEAQTDRLRLSAERIESIASGLEEVAALPDPIGEIIDKTVRPNGLEIAKVRVPLGVVFFI